MTANLVLSTIDISQIFHNSVSEDRDMSTLKHLREQTGWTAFELAGNAGVSLSTINRLESGNPQKAVSTRIAYKVLNTLGDKLGRRITLEDVEGLHVR